MSATFRSRYAGFLLCPRATIEAVLTDERRVRFGFLAVLVPLVGYVIVYIGLSRSGAYPSKFSPWLALPAETYYRYNIFLLPPSILAGWLLAAAVVQLLGCVLGGRGSFEDTLCALGFAISAASWSLLPHDVTVGVLGGIGVIDGRAHEHAMNAPTVARAIGAMRDREGPRECVESGHEPPSWRQSAGQSLPAAAPCRYGER